jgi:hypothetical protein
MRHALVPSLGRLPGMQEQLEAGCKVSGPLPTGHPIWMAFGPPAEQAAALNLCGSASGCSPFVAVDAPCCSAGCWLLVPLRAPPRPAPPRPSGG